MSLKKSLPIFCALFLLCANSAQARIYVGLEAQSNNVKYKQPSSISLAGGASYSIKSNDYYKSNFVSPGVFVGYDNNDFFKLELGYSRINGDKSNDNTGLIYVNNGAKVTTKTNSTMDVLNLDFKPYLKEKALTVYGIIGISAFHSKFKEQYFGNGQATATLKDSSTNLGASIGLGAEFEVIKNLALRVQGKYTFINSTASNVLGIDGVKNIMTLAAGLAYYF